MQASCKKNVFKQFQTIRNLPKNLQAKSSVLVLDTMTAPILSELFSLQQLLEIGIKDLVRVDKIKKPEPASIAIYFISCSSLQHLYKDFAAKALTKMQKDDQSSQHSNSEEAESTHQSLYFSINLLLCQQASKQILHDISEHQEIIEKIASFGELYIPCRYAGNNVGIIAFSKITEDHVQSLRKASKIGNTRESQGSTTAANDEQAQMQIRKKQHTQHFIHKNNLSCLPVIYFYEYEKAKTSKQLQKLQKIQRDLQEFGKKLCQSVIAGINIGLATTVKVIYYQSKFSTKIRESFMSHFNQFMQAKLQEIHQVEMNESITGEKTSLFLQESDQEAKELIVVIADRELDNLSPLVRSFYYSPLLRDIFEINDPPESQIKIVSKKIQPTIIQADDKIYGMYKNQFTPQIFQTINQHLQDYITKNKAGKFHKETSEKKNNEMEIEMKEKSAKQLRQVIKELPQYKKTIKSYHTNIEIMNCIAPMLKQRNLYEEAELEHLIITGYGGDRKQVKDKKILEKIFVFLEDPRLTAQDKCRLMILGVCCLDIDSSQRKKLITRLSKVQGHGDIALGLSKISNKGIKKYPIALDKSNKDVYMDRHQSTLASLMDQLLSNSNAKLKSMKVDEIKPLESSNKPSLKGSLSKQKQRNIEYVVSMCGGMGFNQITDIERVFKNTNQPNLHVNFITDYIFTPSQYLEQLCTLL